MSKLIRRVADMDALHRQIEQLKAENERFKKQVEELREENERLYGELKIYVEANDRYDKVITNRIAQLEEAIRKYCFWMRKFLNDKVVGQPPSLDELEQALNPQDNQKEK